MINISPAQMSAYIATARQRQQAEAEQLRTRYEQGWAVARQGAKMLKEEFGATHVVVFGSLLDASRIHAQSDVDLAVWGLDRKVYFKAVAYLQDIDPAFKVDLVEPENAYPYVVAAIAQGVEL